MGRGPTTASTRRIGAPSLVGSWSFGGCAPPAGYAERWPDTYRGMNSRVSSRTCASIAAAIVLFGCSSHSGQPFCTLPEEIAPEHSLSLAVHVSQAKVAIGDTVQVRYELTNLSKVALTASTDGWDEYRLIGADGRWIGRVNASTTCPPLNDVLRVPPGATISWSRPLRVPDVAVGQAQLIGVFRSVCSGWSGEVRSDPVVLDILARSTDHVDP